MSAAKDLTGYTFYSRFPFSLLAGRFDQGYAASATGEIPPRFSPFALLRAGYRDDS
ncbi:MAG: hypothetical protein AAF804_04605 [Bacteroidota bacterium]